MNKSNEQTTEKSTQKSQIIKVVIAVVAALGVLGLTSTFLRDTLYTGSEIQVSDLVDERAEGISFKRPSQWQVAQDPEIEIVYTEDGKVLDDADQGLLLTSENLGVDYTALEPEQQEAFAANFQEQFSDASSLEDSGCTEVSSIETKTVEQAGYDTAFMVEAECSQFTGRNVEATLKMLFASDGEDMHIGAVLAINETWDKSQEALDAVIASITPVE